MTNKWVVVINSLKVPKIKKKKTILNEISCTKLQLPPEPLTRGLPPRDRRSLCPLSSTEFGETPPVPNKIPGYATGDNVSYVQGTLISPILTVKQSKTAENGADTLSRNVGTQLPMNVAQHPRKAGTPKTTCRSGADKGNDGAPRRPAEAPLTRS